MIKKIEDDFDIKKIADSGQCFRLEQFSDGKYRAVTGESVCYIAPAPSGGWEFEYFPENNPDQSEIWNSYFDMARNYAEIRNRIPPTDSFMLAASEFGKGIRILRQDAWEMLVSFIISQRKSIPAIKKGIDTLCQRYGKEISTPYETLYAFPTADALMAATVEDLRECGLGYRAPYIADAVHKVAAGRLDLDALASQPNEALLEALRSVHGVGEKVANCVLLFGYGRVDCAPVDVWIQRAIETYYQGRSPFQDYGPDSGVLQQYMFYYIRNRL